MFKQIISLIILLTLLVIFPKTALASWQYYAGNPVLSPSADSWDNKSVTVPTVIYDNGKLKMWYHGISSDNASGFGLAESDDGITWQKKSASPLLVPENESGVTQISIEEPVVIKNNIYHMWYCSTDADQKYHIHYATSADGINWQKYPGYVLSGSESWESRGVTNPFVIYKDGQYWMWYQAWGSGNWKIGFAQSTDGIHWQKYPGNPLILPESLGVDGNPGVIFMNNKFYLWYTSFTMAISQNVYHAVSTDGINWRCEEDCHPFTINPAGFNSYANYSHRPVLKNQDLLMYFAGSDGITAQIGLYRWIEEKKPVVILPGIFASWNKNALFYNQNVSQADWKLFSGVKEYDGLISTLKNLNYQENQDYFIFTYDWRKSIDQTTNDLNSFLQEKIWSSKPSQKINLVGHSLGGLIARIWAQKFIDQRVNKLITIGSPHQGIVQTYKPIEAGELDRENTLLWLAEKLILFLNKSTLESDKTTIQNKFPVIKDLFPTFNFLKDTNSNDISINSLSIQNSLLNQYNSNTSLILPYTYSLFSKKESTLAGYKIIQRNILDQLANNYIDGHPQESFFDLGDKTALAKSSQFGNNFIELAYDHSSLITQQEPLKKIFDLMSVKYDDAQINLGQKTAITPSLIFLIKSPITLKINYADQQFTQNDEGIIFIDNAQEGNYQLNAQGNDIGQYEIDVLQIAENNELFEKILGEIVSVPASSQTDQYSFNFNSQTAISILLTPTPTPTNTPVPLLPTLIPTLTPTPTPSPTIIITITPIPTVTSFSPTITPQPTTAPQIIITQTTQVTNNIIQPTIVVNNTYSQTNPTIIISQTPVTIYLANNQKDEVLGIKSDTSLNKNENSLNNLWRIIIILSAVTCIGFYILARARVKS